MHYQLRTQQLEKNMWLSQQKGFIHIIYGRHGLDRYTEQLIMFRQTDLQKFP